MKEQPQLIRAGAGTGKTTTIVKKIVDAIEKDDIDPSQVLALTFSKEAARNMKEKAEELLNGKEINVKTFHSFCAELIRDNADKCKISDDFKIFEQVETAIFIYRELEVDARIASLYAHTILKAKDLNIQPSDFKNYIKTIKTQIHTIEKDKSLWKERYLEFKTELNTLHLRLPEDKKAIKDEKSRYTEFIELYDKYLKYANFISAWRKYEEKKLEINTLDFGDLNKLALEYLNTYGTKEIDNAFKFIVVDEFQDTNYVQFELIKKLSEVTKNITVVADPNQTIYAFRGAYSNNIDEFKKLFSLSDKDIVTLGTNYRSTNKILRVAHSLIEKNYEDPKDCQLLKNFKNKEGSNVTIIETEDDNEEARAIVEKIEEFLSKGVLPKDIAVLYRTHAQGRKVKQAIENKNLPYSVNDDADFLKRPEIKTALAYLYIINNISHPTERGTEAWWRILHYNNALSQKDSIRIGEYIKKNYISFQESIYNHIDDLNLSKSGIETLTNLKNKIEVLCESKSLDVSELILEMYDKSGLSRTIPYKNESRNKEILLNLKQLYELAENFEEFHKKDLSMFIDYIEILDVMEGSPSPAKIENENSIKLMTIHAAKGLEFKVVFITNFAKDKFPLYRGGSESLIPYELMYQYKDIFEDKTITNIEKAISERKKEIKREEERRLAYVAITRAKEHLFLTLAIKYTDEDREPSEFLKDIGYNNWRMGKNITVGDIDYIRDTDIKVREIIKGTALEQEKHKYKRILIESLESGNFNEIMKNMLMFHSLKNESVEDLKPIIDINWDKINPNRDAKRILKDIEKRSSGLIFDPKNTIFSYSTISSYEACPKKYELAEILRMPSRSGRSASGAANMGIFIHRVLETAVKRKISTKQELLEIRDRTHTKPDFRTVDLATATSILEVFWRRNKDSIKYNLLVENRFIVQIEGFNFKGFIDRVDLIPGTKNEVEVTDYKTGKYEPGPVERSRQLLLYAKGAEHSLHKHKVKRLKLEELSLPTSRVFEWNGKEFECISSSRMDALDNNAINDMVEIAKKVAYDYEHGFKKTKNEKICEECGFNLYCKE